MKEGVCDVDPEKGTAQESGYENEAWYEDG